MLKFAVLILAAAVAVNAQHYETLVDVVPDSEELDEVEKRYTPELKSLLINAKEEALLLYTEYSGRNGGELIAFRKDIFSHYNETLDRVLAETYDVGENCQRSLEKDLIRIQKETYKAAVFNAENHHKFLLGHIIVMRMHLNKSEDIIKRCDRYVSTCGIACETQPRVKRWRRHALAEINRVTEDIQHSRKYYKDIVIHAKRRINNLKKTINIKTEKALANFKVCSSKNQVY